MNTNIFKHVSVRGRVAYGICCLESAINYYNLKHLDWSSLLHILWSYTNENVGRWHEIMAESSPDSILEDLSYFQKGNTNISMEQYNYLINIYKHSNKVIHFIINTITDIWTYDLYSSIVNNSPQTLAYLSEIISLMEQENIPLPAVESFLQFSIQENGGWGRAFTREEIFNQS